MPAAAVIEHMTIVRAGPAHPYYSKSLEALTELQRRLGDEYLIPTILAAEPTERWKDLPVGARDRGSYLAAKVEERRGNLARARALLEGIEARSEVYAQSRYLLGVMASDPRSPDGAQPERAIADFQQALNASSSSEPSSVRTRHLSMLGLGRAYYGIRQYDKSVEWYERVPTRSDFWDQALFEKAFARFQSGDPGGALGALQSLHAPQFEGAFQPESWILTATIYYFNCLYQEARQALDGFDSVYPPMGQAVEAFLASGASRGELLNTVARGEAVPRPVVLHVRQNERLEGVLRMLSEIDREIRDLRADGAGLSPELLSALKRNRDTLTQVGSQIVRNRLEEAARNVRGFAEQAEIIRFETAKAQKELAEAGIDQEQILKRQVLHRPALPNDAWQYWKFEGEFWLDEIGYYRHTLKRGCPSR
jgi:hypothetical protein